MKYFWGDPFDSRFYVAYLVSKQKSELILDIGCGPGVILHSANSLLKMGLDNSLEKLKIAKQFDSTMELIQGDARLLPFRNNFCPKILAIHSISESADKKEERAKVCEEIKRISGNNCKLIITAANFWSKHYKKPERVKTSSITPEELIDSFGEEFKIKIEGYNPFSRILVYPIKKILYHLPEKFVEDLMIERILFRIFRSKRFLKNGRSFIMICKKKELP